LNYLAAKPQSAENKDIVGSNTCPNTSNVTAVRDKDRRGTKRGYGPQIFLNFVYTMLLYFLVHVFLEVLGYVFYLFVKLYII